MSSIIRNAALVVSIATLIIPFLIGIEHLAARTLNHGIAFAIAPMIASIIAVIYLFYELKNSKNPE